MRHSSFNAFGVIVHNDSGGWDQYSRNHSDVLQHNPLPTDWVQHEQLQLIPEDHYTFNLPMFANRLYYSMYPLSTENAGNIELLMTKIKVVVTELSQIKRV